MNKFNRFEVVKKELRSEKIEKVKQKFWEVSQKNGLNLIQNVDITAPEGDLTLNFTNSTMARYKNEIAGNCLPANGLGIVQGCLRSWGINDYLNPDFDLEYNSVFTMAGILFSGEDPRNITDQAMAFLIESGLKKDRIYIKTSNNSIYANRGISTFYPEKLLLDTENEEFYKWTYGLDAFTGEGVTFAYQNSRGEIRDLGNIICFLGKENQIIGWEYAFGIETLIAVRDGTNLYNAHAIWDIVSYENNPLLRKKMDCLVASIEIINTGVKPESKGANAGNMLNRYLRVLFELNQLEPIDLDKIIEKYCQIKKYDHSFVINEFTLFKKRIEESKSKNMKIFQRFLRTKHEMTVEHLIKYAKESHGLNLSEKDIESLLQAINK